jgi:hypothetical protein
MGLSLHLCSMLRQVIRHNPFLTDVNLAQSRSDVILLLRIGGQSSYNSEKPMSTTTIRVSTATRDTLRDMAQNAGLSMQQLLEQALEVYRRQQLLQAANIAYENLSVDSEAWHDFQQSQKDWEATLADGLDSL